MTLVRLVLEQCYSKPGKQRVKVAAKTQGAEAMNLEAVVLKPVR